MKCHQKECGETATTGKCCRLHYIAQWQQHRRRETKAKEKMLDKYIKAITERYPDQYLEIIKRDLSNEDSFRKTLKSLGLEDVSSREIQEAYQDILSKLNEE